MTKELLVVPPISIEGLIVDGKLKLPEEEIKRRDELLAEATPIAEVNTEADRDHAINVAARIKGMEDEMEQVRVKAKEPFYRMGYAIDATAKDFSASLKAERERLNRLNGAFEAKRIQAQRQAEADRQAELNRIELERQRLEKEAAEAAAAAERARKPENKAAQLEKALDLEDKAAELEEQVLVVRQQAVAAQAEKPKGGSQRMEIEIKITNIHALLEAKPELVELKPREAQIKYYIRNLLKENETLPGVSYKFVPVYSANKR